MLCKQSVILLLIVVAVSAKPAMITKLASHHANSGHILKYCKLLSCSANSCFLITRISIDNIPEFHCQNENLAITVHYRTVNGGVETESHSPAFLQPLSPTGVSGLGNILKKEQNPSKACQKIKR